MEIISDDDINKEEGEITDDDESETSRADRGKPLNERRRYESTSRSRSQNFHPDLRRQRESDRSLFSCSPDNSFRSFHESGNRPYAEDSRLKGNHEPWSTRRGNEYGIGSRDYKAQEDRRYEQQLQGNGSSSSTSWVHRKFYSSSNSGRNSYQPESDTQHSRAPRNDRLKMSSTMQAYFGIVRNAPESTGPRNFSAHQDTSQMDSDYDSLLSRYTQLQEEIKEVAGKQGAPSPDRRGESKTDVQSGASNTKQASALEVEARAQLLEQIPLPTSTFIDLVSDVSSDEMDAGSAEVIKVPSSGTVGSVADSEKAVAAASSCSEVGVVGASDSAGLDQLGVSSSGEDVGAISSAADTDSVRIRNLAGGVTVSADHETVAVTADDEAVALSVTADHEAVAVSADRETASIASDNEAVAATAEHAGAADTSEYLDDLLSSLAAPQSVSPPQPPFAEEIEEEEELDELQLRLLALQSTLKQNTNKEDHFSASSQSPSSVSREQADGTIVQPPRNAAEELPTGTSVHNKSASKSDSDHQPTSQNNSKSGHSDQASSTRKSSLKDGHRTKSSSQNKVPRERTSESSLVEQERSSSRSAARGSVQKSLKQRGSAKGKVQDIGGAKESLKERGGAGGSVKDKSRAKDTSKEKVGTKESSKEKSSARENSKERGSSTKDSSKERDLDARPGKGRSGKSQAEAPGEKENSARRTRKDAKETTPSKHSRPLPFAPVRLEKITLTPKSFSPRAGALTDAARRAQRRARQTSVARQLPPRARSPSVSRNSRRQSVAASRKQEDSEREQEIARILTLPDQKERMNRLLKLINKVEKSSSPLKAPSKLPPLTQTDNYEEVEMDIDSEDDMTEALHIDDIQTAMQPVPAVGVEPVDLMRTDPLTAQSIPFMLAQQGPWLAAPYLPYVMPPLPPAHPPLPPPLPEEEALPPLPPPEDPPPPPPPSEFLSPVSSECSVRNDEQRVFSMEQFFQSITRQTGAPREGAVSAERPLLLSPPSPYLQSLSQKAVQPAEACLRLKAAASSVTSPSKPTIDLTSPQKAVVSEVGDDDDDDEDEARLRAQLLRSLLARRKQEAEGLTTSPSSRDSSPCRSATASPKQLTVTKSRAAPSRQVTLVKGPSYPKRLMELPVHKPVVVQLASDSSSEDEGQWDRGRGDKSSGPVSGLDIDSFLKEQRDSVQVKGVGENGQSSPAGKRSDTRVVEVQTLGEDVDKPDKSSEDVSSPLREVDHGLRLMQQRELDLTRRRRAIQSDQAKLKMLVSKLSQFQSNQKKAEMEAAQLRKQMEQMKKQMTVYEKYLLGNSRLVASGKHQAKLTKDSVLTKKESYKAAALETLSLGRKLLGPGFQLGSVAIPHVDLKRKLFLEGDQGLTVTVKRTLNKKARYDPTMVGGPQPGSKGESGSGKEGKAQRMAELQQRSQDIKERLQQIDRLRMEATFKEMEAATAAATAATATAKAAKAAAAKSAGDASEQYRPEDVDSEHAGRVSRLPSLESIKLEPVGQGPENVAVRSRRRSLMDMTQSPKPTLLLKDGGGEGGRGGGASSAGTGVKKERPSLDLKMPSGAQLRRLCESQRLKNQSLLSSTTRQPQEMLSHLSQPCLPVAGLKMALSGRGRSREAEDRVSSKLAYSSPLLHCRAYRFSPYYRTKEGLTLTSASHSHKLNPSRLLCRYDLTGVCNDQHCSWQHLRDYKQSEREVLMDLVSYCPRLAGVTKDTPPSSYPAVIGEYVDTLLSQHKGKVSTDDLCLLLTAKVNEKAKHVRPHTMFYDRRLWRPSAVESSTFSLAVTSEFQTPSDSISARKTSAKEADCVLDVDDVRYFVTEGQEEGEVQDMEGAVLATPSDTNLWLRLAYSKLSNPARPSGECLSQALNVVSRGLESNKESCELWVHYLTLFQRHPDAATDQEGLCHTALACAPCYDVWWLLLEASTGFHSKDRVCNRILDFLRQKQEEEGPPEGVKSEEGGAPLVPDEVSSHQLLETVLYKANLNIQSGRFQLALNWMKSILGVKESAGRERELCRSLSHADRCVLWICLVHLLEFKCLPPDLYDPAHQNPGRIRSKDRLFIPWHSKDSLATSLETLVQYLGQAVTVDLDARLTSGAPSHYVMAVQNLAQLLRSQQKYVEACQILKPVLQCVPHLEEVWLFVADIYAGCQDTANAKQVLLDATSANTYSAKLHHHGALMEMMQGNMDIALEQLEQFVLHHFQFSQEEMAKADPNLLFAKLLGLEVVARKRIPPLKEEARSPAAERSPHLWLCYCLLLELQGESRVVTDTYEQALSATTRAADLVTLWKCYVQFLCRQHGKIAGAGSGGADSAGTGMGAAAADSLRQLQEVMLRSIVTAPTLVSDPFPRQHGPRRRPWRDFSHVMDLLDFYLDLVPQDAWVTALHALHDLMPDNIPLLLRCVETAVTEGQVRQARSLCAGAVYDKTANLHLWKLALALAHQEGTPKEVERLYMRAVTAMPLSMSLWKDLLLWEVSQENPAAVHTILAQCHTLGVNVEGYVNFIMSSSSSASS